MPKKVKVTGNRRKRRPRRSKQEKDLERFLEHARSIGIDPTYDEFQRVLKRLISPKRQGRRALRVISPRRLSLAAVYAAPA